MGIAAMKVELWELKSLSTASPEHAPLRLKHLVTKGIVRSVTKRGDGRGTKLIAARDLEVFKVVSDLVDAQCLPHEVLKKASDCLYALPLTKPLSGFLVLNRSEHRGRLNWHASFHESSTTARSYRGLNIIFEVRNLRDFVVSVTRVRGSADFVFRSVRAQEEHNLSDPSFKSRNLSRKMV